MEINPEIKEIFKANNINIDVGLLYLLGLHFKLETEEVISDTIKKQIYITKIVIRDYSTSSISWNVPLFVGQEIAFEWVEHWRKKFGEINIERKGDKVATITNMKKFFSENPEVRKEDVIRATELYHKSVNNPTYLKHAHKFIFEGLGKSKISMLRQWLEIYYSQINRGETNIHQKGQVL